MPITGWSLNYCWNCEVQLAPDDFDGECSACGHEDETTVVHCKNEPQVKHTAQVATEYLFKVIALVGAENGCIVLGWDGGGEIIADGDNYIVFKNADELVSEYNKLEQEWNE